MQSLAPALQTTLAASAIAWPLLAGLTVVLWSKARAVPEPVRVKARR
jgi:hypothetical protein